MKIAPILSSLQGKHVHCVGIKGTGLCAMAELLLGRGAVVSGSDVAEEFYTDAILADLGIPVRLFTAENIDANLNLVIHSAAYDRSSHPELLAASRLGLPIASYPEALGALSDQYISCAIAGVHGKTTTTALCGSLVQSSGLPASVLAGSAVSGFGGRSTLVQGQAFFIAETCEYRRHFLNFHPRFAVVTSIEPDHQDYYPDFEAIFSAFMDFGRSLPKGGSLIYCADDPGASRLAVELGKERPDLRIAGYGWQATGAYRLACLPETEAPGFRLAVWPDQDFHLQLPGEHLVLDAAAALALVDSLLSTHPEHAKPEAGPLPARLAQGLAAFKGSKRRSELIGTSKDIIIMDDYAHHPTAIRLTLAGLRRHYPRRRLFVSFMAHTYSRTQALFDDFIHAFGDADVLLLHDIYPSAREGSPENFSVSGPGLFAAVQAVHSDCRYFEHPLSATDWLLAELRPGDLFISLGAGDNWQLAKAVHTRLLAQEQP